MYQETQHTTLYYEECGEGRPLVIFPALGHSHQVMQALLEPLFQARTGWKRIYVDLPGMGHSPAGNVSSSDQILEALLQLIDDVLNGQRFCIAGMSLGGYMAQGILHQKRELIDGMMLIVPLVHPYQRNAPDQVVLECDETLREKLNETEVKLFQNGFVRQTEANWAKYRDVVLPSVQLQDQHFLAPTGEWRSQNYSFSFRVDEFEQPFARPVLVLTGRQDHQVGFKHAFQLLDNYPRASFAVLDLAGHYLVFEQQELFLALASEWLDRVEQEPRR